MHQRNGHRIVSQERNSSRQHFVQDDAQGIEIGFFIHISASGLFWRKVMYGTDDGPFLPYAADDGSVIHRLGNTEVCDFGGSFLSHQHVVRFDVPMDDVIFMSQA